MPLPSRAPVRSFPCAALFAAAPLVLLPSPAAAAPSAGDGDAAAVVDRLGAILTERYVFPEVAQRCVERLHAELERGAFDGLAAPPALAAALTDVLQDVTHDKHLRVHPRPPAAARHESDTAAATEAFLSEMRSGNLGFERLERLDGGVGYLDLSAFAPEPLMRDVLAGAMAFLARSDAIVLDLRQNGGGSPETVRLLCSYFFDRPTHLNDLWFREGPVVQEFWTLPSVPGARLGDVPLFVLTSSRTFSGAEECAYDLQTQHRATIVGETTGGGANPGGDQPIDEQLSVFVPVGKAVNPVTGTNWEGTGVAPDVACPAGQALDRALELARREAARRAAERSAERIEILHGIQDDVHAAGAAYAAGDPDQGAEILRAALSDGAAAGAVNQLVALRLAGAETGAGRLEVAAGLLGAAVELWPELGAAWSALSDVDEQRGAKEEALGAARRVLALDPHDVGARARVERLSGK